MKKSCFGRLGLNNCVNRSIRMSCKIRTSLISRKDKIFADIVNISKNGICLNIEKTAHFKVGESVTVRTREFGAVSGRVIWTKRGHLGVSVWEEFADPRLVGRHQDTGSWILNVLSRFFPRS